jgi:hypothetical protein
VSQSNAGVLLSAESAQRDTRVGPDIRQCFSTEGGSKERAAARDGEDEAVPNVKSSSTISSHLRGLIPAIGAPSGDTRREGAR